MISTIYIAKNVYGGDGLGRLGDGRVVFVPGAWAGEQVRAEIVEEKRHFVKARLVEVVEPSPERQPAAAALPGMVYAGLSEAGELAAKEQQLREFFERARIAVGEWRSAPPVARSNYRNKVVYHFARQGGQWVIGYREEPAHTIVDVSIDPLARPEINAALPEIRKAILALLTTGPMNIRRETEQKGQVTIRWTAKTGVKWWLGAAPKGLALKETTAGLDFEVPAGGFYQVNPEAGEQLVQAVLEEYRRDAELAPEVLDLYCGVGVFGLSCRPPKLTGIESGREAIDFARRNAEQQQRLPGAAPSVCRFFAEEVGRNLRRIAVGAKTTVIVDPPRGGLEPGVARWLANSRAPRIFYVSCDPATLMRDLRELTRTYAVERVRWFNMFPLTARFETLVGLRKLPAAGRSPQS